MDTIKNTFKAGVELGGMVFVGVITYQILCGAMEGLKKTIDETKKAKNEA